MQSYFEVATLGVRETADPVPGQRELRPRHRYGRWIHHGPGASDSHVGAVPGVLGTPGRSRYTTAELVQLRQLPGIGDPHYLTEF